MAARCPKECNDFERGDFNGGPLHAPQKRVAGGEPQGLASGLVVLRQRRPDIGGPIQ